MFAIVDSGPSYVFKRYFISRYFASALPQSLALAKPSRRICPYPPNSSTSPTCMRRDVVKGDCTTLPMGTRDAQEGVSHFEAILAGAVWVVSLSVG